MNPEFNRCAVAISPSVIAPWGWHARTSPVVCICYNAYNRSVVFRRENREVCAAFSLRSSAYWERFGICPRGYGHQEITDDWSVPNRVDEWLALKACTGIEGVDFKGIYINGAASRGGAMVEENGIYTPFMDTVVEKLGTHLLMIAPPESNECVDRFGDDNISCSNLPALTEITQHLIGHLGRGDFDTAGKIGDIYWSHWSKGTNLPQPSSRHYVGARTAGALGGFPLNTDGALALLVPPERRDRVIASLPGWNSLPFTVTPWGARLCGLF